MVTALFTRVSLSRVSYFHLEESTDATEGYPTFGVGVADTVDIKVSDLVIASTTYSLIVNRTQLECLACSDGGEAVQTVPGSSYPYTRLASISSGNSFFLYNQINDTTFAENFFDVAVGGWHESKNISIGTL